MADRINPPLKIHCNYVLCILRWIIDGHKHDSHKLKWSIQTNKCFSIYSSKIIIKIRSVKPFSVSISIKTRMNELNSGYVCRFNMYESSFNLWMLITPSVTEHRQNYFRLEQNLLVLLLLVEEMCMYISLFVCRSRYHCWRSLFVVSKRRQQNAYSYHPHAH